MKRNIMITLLIGLTYLSSNGQTYHELKVGDQVPDITIRNFFDDDKKAVKISDMYRHKLLILDFWATWCGACLDEMANFPRLKAEFGDKLNILSVGYESKEKIGFLFKRNPIYHNKEWPTIYADSLMSFILFPHHTLPHLVWIDSTGRVKTITEGDKLTSENIRDVFNGKKVNARVKIDNENYAPSIMLKPFRQMDTDFIARSILTRRMNGGGVGFVSMQPLSADLSPLFTRNYNGNVTLWALYWRALFPLDACYFNEDRLIFECADSLRFVKPSKSKEAIRNSKYEIWDNYADSNTYCYEMIVPRPLPDSVLRAYMLSDLNRYLNLNGRWENREMVCYAIRNAKDRLKDVIVEPDSTKETYYNSKVEPITYTELLKLINKRIIEKYVLNESSIPFDKILNIRSSIRDGITPSGLSSFLTHLELKLVKVKRKIPVYVVSE